MNARGNPAFLKIRNTDNRALNAKKKQTADDEAVRVYAQFCEKMEEESTQALIAIYLNRKGKNKLTLAIVADLLNGWSIETTSHNSSLKWLPNSVRRVQKRILDLMGVDILEAPVEDKG